MTAETQTRGDSRNSRVAFRAFTIVMILGMVLYVLPKILGFSPLVGLKTLFAGTLALTVIAAYYRLTESIGKEVE